MLLNSDLSPMCIKVIVAPGTTAPLGSLIVPESRPVAAPHSETFEQSSIIRLPRHALRLSLCRLARMFPKPYWEPAEWVAHTSDTLRCMRPLKIAHMARSGQVCATPESHRWVHRVHSVVFRRNQKQILGRLTVFWGLAALPFVAPQKLLSTPDSSVAPSVVANAGGR